LSNNYRFRSDMSFFSGQRGGHLVKVLRRGWHPEAPNDPAPDKPGYVVILELWLGGKVALERVKAPLNVQVQSGGEIKKFIAEHQEKCQEAKPPFQQASTSVEPD
jgi:hypothetical protein